MDQVVFQHVMKRQALGTALAIRDFEHHKRLYDACLEGRDFEQV